MDEVLCDSSSNDEFLKLICNSMKIPNYSVVDEGRGGVIPNKNIHMRKPVKMVK